MYELVLAIIIVLFIFIFALIKIMFPFWNMLPVYHNYDFLVPLRSSPFLVKTTPQRNFKYHDELQYKTINYYDIDDSQMEDVIKLLQNNYIQSDKMLYEINSKMLDEYYLGSQLPSYVTIYRTQMFRYLENKLSVFTMGYLQGMYGSYPIRIEIQRSNDKITYNAHFINHMCCHRDEKDNKKINRSLLCSHTYNVFTDSLKNNKPIDAMIFRKENDSYKGFVPFVRYDCIQYLITKNENMDVNMKKGYFISKMNNKNINQVEDYLESMEFQYKVLNDIKQIMDSKHTTIYLHYYQTTIIGLFVFKNTAIFCEETDGYIMECISSHNNLNNVFETHKIKDNQDLKNANTRHEIMFTIAFNNIVKNLRKQNVSKVRIHNLAHNNQIINQWRKGDYKYITNLYLYNLIVPQSPVQSSLCFSTS